VGYEYLDNAVAAPDIVGGDVSVTGIVEEEMVDFVVGIVEISEKSMIGADFEARLNLSELVEEVVYADHQQAHQ